MGGNETFADILDLVFYPIREVFKLLQNQAIADYIGFTVLDLAITGLVIMIVCKFLLNPAVLNDRAIRVSKDIRTDSNTQSVHTEYTNPRKLNSGFSGYLKGGKD